MNIVEMTNVMCQNFLLNLHGKNDFAKRIKILLDTDLKIILLEHQNNFVRILKIINNAVKIFDILISSSVLHNYFNSSTKLFFQSTG